MFENLHHPALKRRSFPPSPARQLAERLSRNLERPRRWGTGWLMAALFAAVGVALVALALEAHGERMVVLAHSRDEAAELRRTLFVAEDRLVEIDVARRSEGARAAALGETIT